MKKLQTSANNRLLGVAKQTFDAGTYARLAEVLNNGTKADIPVLVRELFQERPASPNIVPGPKNNAFLAACKLIFDKLAYLRILHTMRTEGELMAYRVTTEYLSVSVTAKNVRKYVVTSAAEFVTRALRSQQRPR